MADPLSIAASIAGLAGLADIVFTRLVKYGRTVKNAEREIQSLLSEVNLLASSLDGLKRLARALEDGEFDRNIRMHHIDACNDTLMDMDKKLRKADEKSVKQKLMWPFRSERAKEWLEELARHKDNINLALSANSLDAMLRLLAQEDRHATEISAEIKETRKITSRIHGDLKHRKVLDFFLKYNPQQNYEMSLRLRHPRTGLWLQRLPEFRHWLETPDSKLWLKGIPGAGKTVLSGSIIETVLGRSSDTVASAFFFCDYKDTRTHDVETILMTLVYQLGIQNEAAYVRMEQYHQELHPPRGLPMNPKATVLRRLLRDMAKLYDQVYLVVDGLDECGKLANEVVDALVEVSEETDNVSMALSSRDEDDIRDHLEEDFDSIEIAAHKEDITEYVTAEIEERIQNRKLRIDNPDLKGEILEGLVDGAKGMFRWVACQLDHLRLCDSDQQCRDALKTLPPDLDTSYVRILERVPEKKIRMVQLALNCIAYAAWPKLTIRQLREMLSVPSPGTFLEPGAIIREGAITKYCSSLIRKSADKMHFEFSHSSVQEFLENELLQASDLRAFWISRSRSRALLATECLKFLRLENFNHPSIGSEASDFEEESGGMEETAADFELYPYAAVQWFQHAYGQWENPRILEHAKALFHPSRTDNFSSWVRQLVNSLSSDDAGDGGDPNKDDLQHFINLDFTTLHMAATLSLPNICSFLLEQGMQVNAKSPLGTPLQCAVQGLYYLDLSSPLGRDLKIYMEAAAAENPGDTGTIGTITSLVRAGASIHLKCSYPHQGRSILDVAFVVVTRTCFLNVPTTLLQLGAPLNHQDVGMAQEAFEHIRRTGDRLYVESLRKLVQALNVAVDKSPEHLRLCRLAWKEAIFFRIDFTSDLTTVDTRVSLTDGDLAEQALEAVRGGNFQALRRILRDPRIDAPSIVNKHGDSLLHLALHYDSCSEDIGIIKLLLDTGCSISKANPYGEQPLHWWDWDLKGGNDKQVKLTDEVAGLLRAFGASCAHQDTDGRNALHIHIDSPVRLNAILTHQPAENIHEAMVSTDEIGFTPFSKALKDQHLQSALILTEELEITPPMVQSPTPVLLLAVQAGAGDILDFLVESGIELPFAEDENPLYYLGPKSTVDTINRLKSLFPETCRRVVGTEPPLALYLKCCLESSSEPGVNMLVMDALSMPDMPAVCADSKCRVWTFFTTHILPMARKLRGILNDSIDDAREDAVTTAVRSLVQLGYFDSFESQTQQSGMISLLDSSPAKRTIVDMWPLSSSLLRLVLDRTKHWSDFRTLARLSTLLKIAVKSCDFDIATVLLTKGVSVHQQVDENGLSVLETVLFSDEGHPDELEENSMITLVLDHADISRLNETSADDGLTLLHRLKIPGKEWLVEELIKRGADPNRRETGARNETPLIHHLLDERDNYATALLRNGADPTLTNDNGYDAAQCASLRSLPSFLAKLLEWNKDNDKIDWSRTCDAVNRIEESERRVLLKFHKVTALHIAALAGSVGVLRFYVDHNLIEDLDVTCDAGWTALHLAVRSGCLDAVEFLCERGCNVNARAVDGSSPLHLASKCKSLEIATFLVKAGCKPSRDSAGRLPSFWAYNTGGQALYDWLHSVESSPDFTQGIHNLHEYVAVSARKQAQALADALEDAIDADDVERCKQLSGSGCSLNISLNSCGGCSPLIKAVEAKRIEIIKWMLMEQRYQMTQTVCHLIPVRSALHLILDDCKLLEVLPESLDNYMNGGGKLLGEVPALIQTTITANNITGSKLLLEHATKNREHYGKLLGQSPESFLTAFVNEIDEDGLTSLHKAAAQGSLIVVQLLVSSGADIDAAQSATWGTPLHWASSDAKNHDIALYFINQRANLESRDHFGRTPLLIAALRGNDLLLQALIRANANVKAVDNSHYSLLHATISQQGMNTTAFADFVRFGLDLNQENVRGFSAFHLAICQPQLISFLLKMDIRLEDMRPYSWRFVTPLDASWLTSAYTLLRKKYGRQMLRKFANLTQLCNWRPLCKSASSGSLMTMENLLDLGVDINCEVCSLGSALMAACAAGQVRSVACLVRHGAALAYDGPNGVRSVISASKDQPHVLRWLLVGRFIDQAKLTAGPYDGLNGGQNWGSFTWAGPIKAEMVITGKLERRPKESSRVYWTRLMNEKAAWRGKILPPNGTSRTSRSANLVPEEPVRVHPEGYALRR